MRGTFPLRDGGREVKLHNVLMMVSKRMNTGEILAEIVWFGFACVV